MERTQSNPIVTIVATMAGLAGLVMFTMMILGLTPADVRSGLNIQREQTTAGPTAVVQPQPTPFATVIIYQPAPVVYTQEDQAPPQIAINQPPPPATAEPSAPVSVQPQPAVIVVHERPDAGQNIVTGSGACKVGGSVARRCGK